MPAEDNIRNALFARMKGLVLTPVLPIAWPNVTFTPPLTPWLRVTHLPTVQRGLTLVGTDEYRGILQVDVFGPLQSGSSYEAIAAKIATHFRPRLQLFAELTRVTITNSLVTNGLSDKTYWQVPVSITYRAYSP